MNEVWKNIVTRRSVREFTNQAIPKDDLMKIAEAGKWAPSGMNRQTRQFTVLNNKEMMERLAAAIVKELALDKDSYNFYNPAALLLVSEESENNNGLANCACALENIFLMAHSMNIGSCWINQLKTICETPGIRSILNELQIPENHTVWGMAALGYVKHVDPMSDADRIEVINYID